MPPCSSFQWQLVILGLASVRTSWDILAALMISENHNFLLRKALWWIVKFSLYLHAGAVYSTLTEIRRQFEIEVNQTLNNLLPRNTFQPLFDYFIEFLYTPDLCPLAGNIQSIIQELFKVIYAGQGGEQMNSNPEKLRCFRNASNSFTFLHLQEILTPLERQLHELKTFIDSLKTAEEIMYAVRGHSFSDTCVQALMKLKYCAYCGGFTKFKPCLFFCLNTLRGCLADVAEIRREFSPFLTALNKVSKDFPSNWQPEVFIANSLRNFATLSRNLKTTDLVSWVRAHFPAWMWCSECMFVMWTGEAWFHKHRLWVQLPLQSS